MATDEKDDQKMIEDTVKLTQEYVKLLNEWVPKRQVTVTRIREIATDLQNTKQNVNISKVVGASVGVLGGIAAVAGTVLTGGLAAPLFIGGVATAIAGSATSAGAGIAEHFISKDKLESAQVVLDDDKKLTQKVEEKKKMVDVKIEQLSSRMNMSNEEVFGMMLMATVPGRGFAYMNPMNVFNMFVSTGLIAITSMTFQSGSAIGKGMGALAEVTLEGFSKVLGSVLKGLTSGALLVLDIYFLVANSIELSEGSPSAAADSLRDVACELEEQANEIKQVLEQLREKTEEYETMLRKKFRKLLGKVAVQECADDEDIKEVMNYIRQHASNNWRQAYQTMHVNENIFVHGIARVFKNFGQIMEDFMKRNNLTGHLNITLIAHGRINPLSQVPCQLYYLTDQLRSITCFPPWGCAIDAKVVYGIATNTIYVPNVQFSGPVRPGHPGAFNILPKSMVLTPDVIFSPVLHGEGAHQDLLQLVRILQGPADGLVIPYFTGVGNDLLPFTEIPLWVCATSVAICASLLNITVSLKIAACLSPENNTAIANSLELGGFFPNLNQYCQVPMNRRPPICMTNTMTYPQNILLQIDTIQGNLFL